jgi:hypothetical protein
LTIIQTLPRPEKNNACDLVGGRTDAINGGVIAAGLDGGFVLV